MAIFMLYESIDGEHMVNDKAGHILLESLSWSLMRNSASVRPGLRSRIEPSVAEVSCTKLSDGSSVALLTEALSGKFNRTVQIMFMRQGNSRLLPYLVYSLYDAGITSFAHAGSSEGTPSESFTLNFTSIDFKYTVFSDDITGIPSNILYNIPDGQ
jgi:type VI secretion system secreted protein Hcp